MLFAIETVRQHMKECVWQHIEASMIRLLQPHGSMGCVCQTGPA